MTTEERSSDGSAGEPPQALDIGHPAASWLVPWAGFVLALGVGRIVGGESTLEVGDLVLGMPLAWLAAWAGRRSGETWLAVGTGVVAAVGLLVGLLA